MNRVSVALVVLASAAVFCAPTDSDGSNSVDKKTPPNEWGPYYTLPEQMPDMAILFRNVLSSYLSSNLPGDKCEKNDAMFERWFQSSKDPNLHILSFYCRTSGVRGYQHLKIKKTGKHDGNVLEFQKSLKLFGIMDAGGYESENTKEGKEAEKLQNELLEKVKPQIKKQPDRDPSKELCPDAGNKTVMTFVETKIENGLYYYKFPVSCNISFSDLDTGGDHVTKIEVVEDKDFKALNGGNATLVGMENPERNIDYVKAMEAALAAKQSHASTVGPMITLLLLPIASRFF